MLPAFEVQRHNGGVRKRAGCQHGVRSRHSDMCWADFPHYSGAHEQDGGFDLEAPAVVVSTLSALANQDRTL